MCLGMWLGDETMVDLLLANPSPNPCPCPNPNPSPNPSPNPNPNPDPNPNQNTGVYAVVELQQCGYPVSLTKVLWLGLGCDRVLGCEA